MPALDMQRSRASAIARALVDRAPAGSIACIFAGGSLARGEVWAAPRDGAIEVYSDVDLYVVTTSPALASVRAAATGLDAVTVAGARFLRPADIGVYTPDDLRSQPARPGTVDLSIHHVVLHGDPAVPRELAFGRMAADESLYLLENRAQELDATDANATGAGARMNLVRALKARLDVHSAHAIVDGSFVATVAGRAAAFETAPPSTLDARARGDIAAAYAAARDLEAWLDERDARAEADRSMDAVSRAWRALAPGVLGAGGESPSRLLERRWREGAWRENARELVRLRRVFGVSLGGAIARAPFLCSRSPRVALRLDALVRRFHAQGDVDAAGYERHRRRLDALTRAYGFSDGPQEMRVREMYRVIS